MVLQCFSWSSSSCRAFLLSPSRICEVHFDLPSPRRIKSRAHGVMTGRGLQTLADDGTDDVTWRGVENSTRSMSVDEEDDDEMLLNFAAIFHFLTAGGGVHELWQASKYRLHSGQVHSSGHDDHMAIRKWRRDDRLTVQNDEFEWTCGSERRCLFSQFAQFVDPHNLSSVTLLLMVRDVFRDGIFLLNCNIEAFWRFCREKCFRTVNSGRQHVFVIFARYFY